MENIDKRAFYEQYMKHLRASTDFREFLESPAGIEFTEQEFDVLFLYLGFDIDRVRTRTFGEIAAILNLPEHEIERIHNNIAKKIRKWP
jgi:DNA-directed RNA polymerase sigma subunit (sigma70/sigma32)